jgi:hypothetical protein
MNDAKMRMMICGAADCLWLMKIWCMQWKRRVKRTDDSPFHHFPCIFHKFHGHFFTKLCLITSFSVIVFTLDAEVGYGRTQNGTAGQCFDFSDMMF